MESLITFFCHLIGVHSPIAIGVVTGLAVASIGYMVIVFSIYVIAAWAQTR